MNTEEFFQSSMPIQSFAAPNHSPEDREKPSVFPKAWLEIVLKVSRSAFGILFPAPPLNRYALKLQQNEGANGHQASCQ